jgi:predicted O-methyltransferase YrrM
MPNKRGRPPKDHWSIALALTDSISPHYAMEEPERELAFKAALALQKGACIVELGVTHGKTAALLCYSAKLTGSKYYGIDNFKTEGSKQLVESTLAKLELKGTILTGDTNSVSWNQKIDYLLIDAGHDESNMRQDAIRWLPLVNPGGLVLFHAYNPQVEYGDPHYPVKRYADYYTERWDTVAYIPYLLIKQKPLK